MASLRHIHQLMNERRHVLLADGRKAKIMRVDTSFPENDTQLTVWTAAAPSGNPDAGPSTAKVERISLTDVVGAAS